MTCFRMVIILTTCLVTGIRGEFLAGPTRTFCDSSAYCEKRGGRLSLATDVTSLQAFMRDRKRPIRATWVGEGPDSVYQDPGRPTEQTYCEAEPSAGRCPGLVALSGSVTELQPPLVDCERTSVKFAICGNNTHFRAVRVAADSSGDRPTGSLCDVITRCDQLGLTIALYGRYSTSSIRGALLRESISATWIIPRNSGQRYKSYCRSTHPKQRCPGEILLRGNHSVVTSDVIDCDVKLPVVCDLSPIQSTTTTTTGISDSTTEDTGDEIGLEGDNNGESYTLTNIIGGVVGALLLIIIIITIVTIVFRLRKRRSRNAQEEIPISETKQYETLKSSPTGGAMVSPSHYTSLHSQGGATPVQESPDGASTYYSQIPDRQGTQVEDSGHYDYVTAPGHGPSVRQGAVSFPDHSPSVRQGAVPDAECDLNPGGHPYLALVPL